MNTEGSLVAVRRLGLVEYEDGLLIQRLIEQERQRGTLPDTLLLLEHPPVITLGRGRRTSQQILCSPERLQELGIDVAETDRGGAATYHGPGQLVAYPILQLRGAERDVHQYLRLLEEVVIRTLVEFGIEAHREVGRTGVWVRGEKIASIGVHLSRWITRHGLALNVTNDLTPFDLIVPCGLSGVRMTSMERVCGRPVSLDQVEEALIAHFGSLFARRPYVKPIDRESVLVILRSVPGNRYLLLKRRAEKGGFWQPVTGFVEAGESPPAAALREVAEETGLKDRYLSLHRLPYTHAFAITPELLADSTLPTPIIVREHTFAAELPDEPTKIKLDPREHTEFELVTYDHALKRVTWAGTRRALKLAEQMLNQLSALKHLDASSRSMFGALP